MDFRTKSNLRRRRGPWTLLMIHTFPHKCTRNGGWKCSMIHPTTKSTSNIEVLRCSSTGQRNRPTTQWIIPSTFRILIDWSMNVFPLRQLSCVCAKFLPFTIDLYRHFAVARKNKIGGGNSRKTVSTIREREKHWEQWRIANIYDPAVNNCKSVLISFNAQHQSYKSKLCSAIVLHLSAG